MMENRTASARRLKQLLIDASPLLEEFTSLVCPGCKDVCCRQKHGMFREGDKRYLEALGGTVPARDAHRPLEGPCELMGPRGCTDPRWMRPFKCTWYFCDSLLAALNEGPQKKARRLSAIMQEMIEVYDRLSAADP